MTAIPSNNLLTLSEAADVLHVGVRTIQERVKSKELGCVKIGRCTRFTREDIESFIQKNRRKAIGWKGTPQA